MSGNGNINDYISNRVIDYLKERDEKMIEYERLLKVYTEHVIIDKCAACKKVIHVRNRNKPIDYWKLVKDGEDGYRRCYCAVPPDNCNTIVCNECENNYEYKWHLGNSWFGVHPRPLSDDDYICIECGKQ